MTSPAVQIKRVQLDLNDKEGMAQSLNNKGVKEITHIYHLAFHGALASLSVA